MKIFTNKRLFAINVGLVFVNLISAFVFLITNIGVALVLRSLMLALLHICLAWVSSQLLKDEEKNKSDTIKSNKKDVK